MPIQETEHGLIYQPSVDIGYYIVPNEVSAAINAALDKAIAEADDPAQAAKEREHLFAMLLSAYNEYGSVPDFSLIRAKLEAEENEIQ